MPILRAVETLLERNPQRAKAIGFLAAIVTGLVTVATFMLTLVIPPVLAFFTTLSSKYPESNVLPILKPVLDTIATRLPVPTVMIILAWTIILLVFLLVLCALYIIAKMSVRNLEHYLYEQMSERLERFVQDRVYELRAPIMEHLNRELEEPEYLYFWAGDICSRTGSYRSIFAGDIVLADIQEGTRFPYVEDSDGRRQTNLWQLVNDDPVERPPTFMRSRPIPSKRIE